jgi:hypothetical protein
MTKSYVKHHLIPKYKEPKLSRATSDRESRSIKSIKSIKSVRSHKEETKSDRSKATLQDDLKTKLKIVESDSYRKREIDRLDSIQQRVIKALGKHKKPSVIMPFKFDKVEKFEMPVDDPVETLIPAKKKPSKLRNI